MFCKKGLRNFENFTANYLYQSLSFFSFCLRICIKCFSVNFAKFLIKPFFTEHFWWLLSMSWFPFIFQALSEKFFWGLHPQSPARVFPWTHWGTYSTLRSDPQLYTSALYALSSVHVNNWLIKKTLFWPPEQSITFTEENFIYVSHQQKLIKKL